MMLLGSYHDATESLFGPLPRRATCVDNNFGLEWTDLFGNWSILEANWVADNKICIGTSSDEWPPPRLYN